MSADDWYYCHQSIASVEGKQALKGDFDHSVQFYHALLREYLPMNKEASIMDLPCGEGRMVYALRAMGYRHIRGYDQDNNRLNTGRKLELPVYEGDVFEVLRSVENGSIDCIIAMDFIEHLKKENVICFLDQAFSKIAPGGALIVRTPCADNPFGIHDIFNDFTHKWAATSGVLRQLLRNTGFSDVRVFGEKPRLSMRFGFIRVLLYIVAATTAGLFLEMLGHGRLRIATSSMWAVARKNDACDQALSKKEHA